MVVASNVRERPRFAGVYTVADAAAVIQATHPEKRSVELDLHRRALDRITTRHLFRWVSEGLSGEYLLGLRGKEVALTFLDLVSLRLIAVLRAHGIPSAEIRRNHTKLQQKHGWTHPFAMEPIWISGLRIYLRENETPVTLDRNSHWQAALDFIEMYVGPIHRLAFGDDKRATTWEPQGGIS